jgi:phospholipid/cholesterol/gamma-HCH transport system substrate-binding protein
VREIRLPEDTSAAGIEVLITINRENVARLRDDSAATLKYLQILSGEKYVDISPGTPGRPSPAEGSTIPSTGEKELLEQGADIAGNINEITASLKNILEPIEKGEGLLGQMVRDPEFGKEGLAALKGTLENLEALSARLRRGQGFVGRLLADEQFAKKVDSIGTSLDELAVVLESARQGKGAIGQLLTEGGQGQLAIEDLRAAAASLRRTAEKLEAKEGLVGRILNDPEYSEALADDLRSVLGDVKEIADKVNSGQGTIAALLNERVIHDSLEDIIAGTNDSKFARWLLRHYQKKGIELQDAAQPKQATPAPDESDDPDK